MPPGTEHCIPFYGYISVFLPEIVSPKRQEQGYSDTVDWWSLGVMTFELLTGCSPFTVDGAKNSSREIAE
jgi:serine/threonine protein kinase